MSDRICICVTTRALTTKVAKTTLTLFGPQKGHVRLLALSLILPGANTVMTQKARIKKEGVDK